MKIIDLDDYFVELRDKIDMFIVYEQKGSVLEMDDDIIHELKVTFYSNINKKRIQISSIRSLIDEIASKIWNSLNLRLTYDKTVLTIYISKVSIINGDNLNFMKDVEI